MPDRPVPTTADRGVGGRLDRASGYAWRLLVLGVATYVVFRVLLRFEAVVVAVFMALIVASLLRPPVNLLSRFLPRRLAATVTAFGVLGLIALIVWQMTESVTNEWSALSAEFSGGIRHIEQWLEKRPFHIKPDTLTNLQGKAGSYIEAHRSALVSQVLNNAGRVVDVVTVLALALFCSIFFTSSGERMWLWFQDQLPATARPTWRRAGSVAWHTFAGYTRGIVLIAAVNAIMVGIALEILRVPLALPLTLLEFTASFIPLIGSPIAMAVATVVALAGRGVTTAAIVLVLIVVFGQIEGHVLQPFVMGWSVRLHPVVIALSVIAGTICAGLLGAVAAVPLVSIAWAVIKELRGNGEPDPDEDDGADADDGHTSAVEADSAATGRSALPVGPGPGE
ncbi:AI-2E family transporter [Actinospica robiniae]|uniref:Putative permease n=1 Tax=Actinospica robiniae DSM 44927 TaxID=479430 RepID=W9E518_9ACTN|nr:AI-2E family transporter [Actinospica robiniae]ETA71126.1 putative permease [Actinospica robiniae DSM 44927]